jgi:hypothetical protein
MRRAVTHQAPATTRRPPLPSSASSGHGDTARHDPQAHRLRARSSPAQRSASRCRGGAGRWAIHWAKPCRIGPYQSQRRVLSGATDWANLQVFRRLGASRTPCFTRERSQVRNPPRPSSGTSADAEVSSFPVAYPAPVGPCAVPGARSRWRRASLRAASSSSVSTASGAMSSAAAIWSWLAPAARRRRAAASGNGSSRRTSSSFTRASVGAGGALVVSGPPLTPAALDVSGGAAYRRSASRWRSSMPSFLKAR